MTQTPEYAAALADVHAIENSHIDKKLGEMLPDVVMQRIFMLGVYGAMRNMSTVDPNNIGAIVGILSSLAITSYKFGHMHGMRAAKNAG